MSVAAGNRVPGVPAAGTTARPADVISASSRYRPYLPELSIEDARRATDLVSTAINGMTPTIVVSRPARHAITLLERSERLPTAFDRDARSDPLGEPYRQRRRQLEEHFGVHGQGADAGGTVYGTVRWDSITHPGERLASWSRRVGGSSYFGGTSLVLDPVTLDRATFLAGDSFTWANVRRTSPAAYDDTHRVGAREQIGQVLTERLVRTYGRPSPAPGSPDNPSPPDISSAFLDLLERPRHEAVNAIREHLVRQPAAGALEAQVRTVRADDVDAIVVEPTPSSDFPDRARVSVAERALLAEAAQARGLPVVSAARFPATADRARQ